MSADDLPRMTLVEHLREFRRRLIYSVAALLFGVLVGLPLAPAVIAGLKGICPVCSLQGLGPTEAFVTYFRVSLVLGLVVAVPVILYQVVAFVLPALHPNERRYLYLLLPGSALMFALGLAFGYFIVLPRTIGFLSEFLIDYIDPNWSSLRYVSFVTNLLLMVGVAFQTPLVVYVLSKMGVISPRSLSKYRRHAIVLLAVLAAMLTPTPDPFTMFIVFVPMILLYELGILLARIA
jgi:sec-independent protein translocase protein TatC